MIGMLTRSGVARRLGKSIATVRRMEGVELHPTRDERGVHRFDPDEVERIARDRAARAYGAPELAQRAKYLETLRGEREAEEADAEEERWWQEFRARQEAWRQEHEAREHAQRIREEQEAAVRERQRLNQENAELKATMRGQILDLLGSCSTRELKALGTDAVERLEDLADELDE